MNIQQNINQALLQSAAIGGLYKEEIKKLFEKKAAQKKAEFEQPLKEAEKQQIKDRLDPENVSGISPSEELEITHEGIELAELQEKQSRANGSARGKAEGKAEQLNKFKKRYFLSTMSWEDET